MQAISDLPSDPTDLLSVRCAEWTDSRTLWLWANDRATRESSFHSDPITWLQHAKWFDKTLQDPNQLPLVFEVLGSAQAFARLQLQGETAEISLNVCPGARGLGFGGRALRQVLSLAFQIWPILDVRARIKSTNTASLRLFSRAGFCPMQIASGEREGIYIYTGKQSSPQHARK